MIGRQIMTQRIKSNIDCYPTQSCEWGLLLIYMITYWKGIHDNMDTLLIVASKSHQLH